MIYSIKLIANVYSQPFWHYIVYSRGLKVRCSLTYRGGIM